MTSNRLVDFIAGAAIAAAVLSVVWAWALHLRRRALQGAYRSLQSALAALAADPALQPRLTEYMAHLSTLAEALARAALR
jgi:uncharacterized membrane protein YccC